MKASDQIFIRDQRVSCRIGVPDEERARAQELAISTTMSPFESSEPLDDDVAKTIDYQAVYERVAAVANERPRRLIETLAEDLAGMIIAEFPVRRVTIGIEKFILPGTRCAGVMITRDHARH
jgi:dihydroneopterin aldolase